MFCHQNKAIKLLKTHFIINQQQGCSSKVIAFLDADHVQAGEPQFASGDWIDGFAKEKIIFTAIAIIVASFVCQRWLETAIKCCLSAGVDVEVEEKANKVEHDRPHSGHMSGQARVDCARVEAVRVNVAIFWLGF